MIGKPTNIWGRFAVFLLTAHCSLLTAHYSPLTASAQTIAILTPEKNEKTATFAESLETSLSNDFKILDRDLSEMAFRSFDHKNSFNLSLKESQNIGAAIGCDYFLLVKLGNQRRVSLERSAYFESYAIIYTVSARTGQLVFWKLQSLEAPQIAPAEKLLFGSVGTLSGEISEKIAASEKIAKTKKAVLALEEIPLANTPAAEGFRPPLPYRRIRPEYTVLASLYGVEATVDIELDLDEKGNILRTEINRWAGFGLDQSVTRTVREMQWRPAERNGKTLPIRALLRYNFKKLEKE